MCIYKPNRLLLNGTFNCESEDSKKQNMNPKVTLAIVLLAFALADAKGGRSGERGRHGHGGHSGGHSGGRGGHPKGGSSSSSESYEIDDGDYNWGIDIDGNIIKQEADIFVNESIIVVESRQLRSANISHSETVFDFSGTTSLAVLGVRGHKCFIISSSKTFDEIKNELAQYNNTNINVTSTIRLKTSGDPLTPAAAQELLAAHPALNKVCGSASIYNTEETSDNPVDGSTKLVKALSVDRLVELIVPYTPRTTPPPPPPPRRFRPFGRH